MMNYIEFVPNIPKIGGRYKAVASGVTYELASVVLTMLGWNLVLYDPEAGKTVTPNLESFETHFIYVEE